MCTTNLNKIKNKFDEKKKKQKSNTVRVKIINRFSYLADNLFSYVHLAVFAKCVILY